jgi:hypothetical protein
MLAATMNATHRLGLLLVLLAAASCASTADGPWVVHPGGDGPGAGKHVVLVSGDEEYRSEEALPQLAKILSTRHGFRCTVLFAVDPETGEIDPDQSGNIPGLAALDDADLMVLFTRFRRLPDADMEHVVDFVESGRPLLGIRTATHAFAYEEDSPSPYASWTWNSSDPSGGFGREVLGETWINHHGKHGEESTRGVIPAGVADHPVLRGVEDVWGPTDVYGISALPDDATVVLEGAVVAGMEPGDPVAEDARNDPRMPIVWLRERELGGGRTQRVVASTIGASLDLESEGLRRLLVNAVYWGLGLEDAIDPERSVAPVGTYEPTMFGFGTFVRGVRPEDHALR